ncbi:MAG: FAD-dependent oxidoreductase [Planctomycetes bacterium]|nr:FAD-dependent oxidoreductase [Planctomycetota bacterium]
MQDRAQVLVIGGGIVGCSAAYHLAKSGCRDVLLVEKGELTSGSTWHAAGLVGQLRSSRNVTRMLKHSVELYESLEAETGQATGWKQVGGLRLACSEERMQELRKGATTARSFGLEMELLSPKEALELFPIMSPKDIVGGAFLPTDGYADPTSVTRALAKGARDGGVTIERGIRVKDFLVKDRRVVGVQTDQGDIEVETVLLAAGMWSRQLGALAGVNVPLIPVMHQYLVTDKIPDIPADLPTMRDPDKLVYYKEEAGALAMGGYEHNPIPWSVDGIPGDFGQQLLEPDFDHFEQISRLAIERTPLLETAGVRELINGPESFTPDGHFIMGRAPELDNFFVGAGFNAHGIAAGGGAGRMLAEWILEGRPSLDLWSVDIRRFGEHHRELGYVRDRTLELYGKHYSIAWPGAEHESGRKLRMSPLYTRLAGQGAVFGSKFGWERANWFAPPGIEARETHPFGKPAWFEPVGAEHRAIREAVALIDQTPFSKLEVSGPGSFEFLQRLVAANLDKAPGGLTYTQLCNERGGIECDLTIARVEDERFYIVTGTAFGGHDMSWIREHLDSSGSIELTDITDTRAVINVCGPRSRELLESVCDDPFDNESFPFAHCHPVRIGNTTILALRVTYVGELGWELHMPMDGATEVYDLLAESGKTLGVQNAGYRAIESCRLEKGYRYWSTDLTADYTPWEAGLGFCVTLDKGDFIGREALLEAKERGVSRKLCCFTLEEYRPLNGGETISRGGEVLGVLTSGGYGYTIGQSIAYGYIPSELTAESDFEVEVMGEPVRAIRHDGALYDSKRERILS